MANEELNKQTATASSFPEHGPIDETGKEVLLEVKNVDITFGKGENAVRAVQDASFKIYKGETFSLVGESTPVPAARSITRVYVSPVRSRAAWTARSSVTSRWSSRIRQRL